jgi:hypothetical protein
MPTVEPLTMARCPERSMFMEDVLGRSALRGFYT